MSVVHYVRCACGNELDINDISIDRCWDMTVDVEQCDTCVCDAIDGIKRVYESTVEDLEDNISNLEEENESLKAELEELRK